MSSEKEKESPPEILMNDEINNVHRENSRLRDFWIGLIAPVTPSIILCIWFNLAGGDVDDLPICLGFMASICIWPVIGSNIASNPNLSDSMRNGGRLSAKISIFVGIMIWLFFLSLTGGGIAN